MSLAPLRIAIAKGRLWGPTIARFTAGGMAPLGEADRRLLIPSTLPGVEFLGVKAGDVAIYVESGAADLGVAGTDVLREANPDVLEPMELGYGACRLAVAAPRAAGYPLLSGGVTPRVATKYPRLARQHFAAQGRSVEIIEVGGSVEVAPLLGLSHWIVDLVDTGETLRANGLVEHETILSVSATLIANRASQKLKLEAHLELMKKLSA